MKINKIAVVLMLVFCLFMGITAISLGVGAIFPSINQIARPVVCPNGGMTPETNRFRPYPGKNVVTVTWYCVDHQTQSKTMVSSLLVSLCAGSIYGVLLFVPLLLLLVVKSRKAGR